VQGSVRDLVVIGGGINGCGIARDAAGRGLSVFLCEQGDLASATSSSSTKLIHGGLRYLEHYEFRLVREALMEREVLLAMAPHIIWPLRFVLPHHAGLRPWWWLRLGLFVYDHLGGRRSLPATRSLNLRSDKAGRPLKDGYDRGFEYSDCWVQDSRLVVLNAMDAAARGAEIATRTRCVSADRVAGPDGSPLWRVTVAGPDGSRRDVLARALVNAAGPWVGAVLGGAVRSNSRAAVRLVKGSHIVVRKLFDHDRAYIFQNGDGRIIFAIPYEREFTLIGTTDQDFRDDPATVRISDDEVGYLCGAASEYFRVAIDPAAVVWTYSGVRPLYDDGATKAQEATRDYVLELDAPAGSAPLLSVFGGKITTFRRLAEAVLDKLAPHVAMAGAWTERSTLPGGDLPQPASGGDRRSGFAATLRRRHPFLSEADADRMARSYGTAAEKILIGSVTADDLGRRFGAGLSEREVRYLMEHEWAVTAADVLWRRSKLGLHFTADEAAALEDFMSASRRSSAQPAA